jgi:predicted metal-dependent hydrolase
MDHSDKFWTVCDQLSQDMDYSRDWLDVYGDKLLSYGSPL